MTRPVSFDEETKTRSFAKEAITTSFAREEVTVSYPIDTTLDDAQPLRPVLMIRIGGVAYILHNDDGAVLLAG